LPVAKTTVTSQLATRQKTEQRPAEPESCQASPEIFKFDQGPELFDGSRSFQEPKLRIKILKGSQSKHHYPARAARFNDALEATALRRYGFLIFFFILFPSFLRRGFTGLRLILGR